MDAVILAGGKSTRMKTNKMLLDVKGHPLIFHTLESVKPFANHIIIVTGKYDKEIKESLKGEKVTFVYNKDYELGMFSSVLTGVKETKDDFFIIPGDCPFVSPSTYEALLNGKEDIRVPTYNGKDGHPIYISKKLKEELLSYPINSNLKLFRDSHKYEIIKTEDKNIVINLNEYLDYLSLLKLTEGR